MGFFEVALRPGRSLRQWLELDELPADAPRGLGSWVGTATFVISLGVSWAALQAVTGSSASSAWEVFVQLVLLAPITTGVLVIVAGVIAITVLALTDFHQSRQLVLARSAKLFRFLAGAAIVFSIVGLVAKWKPKQPSTYGLGDFLLVLLEAGALIIIVVLFIWLLIASYAVLSMFSLDRTSTQTIHPLLGPLVDAQLVLVGLITVVPHVVTGHDSAADTVGFVSAIVVAVFAALDYWQMTRQYRELLQLRQDH